MKAILVEAIHQKLLLFDFGPDFFDDRLVVGALLLAAFGDALQQPRLDLLWDGNAGQQGTDRIRDLSGARTKLLGLSVISLPAQNHDRPLR